MCLVFQIIILKFAESNKYPRAIKVVKNKLKPIIMKRIALIFIAFFTALTIHAESFYYDLNVGDTKPLNVYAWPSSNHYVSKYHWHFPGAYIDIIDGGSMFDSSCTIKAMSPTYNQYIMVECYWYEREYGHYSDRMGGHFMFYIKVSDDGSSSGGGSAVIEVVSSTPSDGDAGVATDVKPVLKFNQSVKLTTNTNTATRCRLESNDGSKIYFNTHFDIIKYPGGKAETEATFTPQQTLQPATKYTFIMPTGSLETDQGTKNSNSFQFSFTTAGESSSTGELLVSSSVPADGAVNVETDIAPMIYFSDDVELVSAQVGYPSDYITLSDDEGRSIVGKYGIQLYKNYIGMEPKLNLRKGTRYTFSIAPGQVKKKGTNIVNKERIEISFTTVEGENGEPMKIVSTSPEDGAIGVELDVEPLIVFSSSICTNETINNRMVLKKSDGTVVERGPLNVQGEKLWIKPTSLLEPGTTYTFYIPNSCLIDPSTAAFVDNDFHFSFTTKAEDSGNNYPIENLSHSVSCPEVVDGALVEGNNINLNISIDNPTKTEFKGHFGVWFYYSENYVLGYSYWPSEDRNEVKVLPGNNQYQIQRTVDSALPVRFDVYLYPEKADRILLGSVTITSRGTSSIQGIYKDARSKDFFNLSGHRLTAPQPGINITQGKKILIK